MRFAVRKAANIIRDEAKAQMIARGNTPGATSKNYATGPGVYVYKGSSSSPS